MFLYGDQIVNDTNTRSLINHLLSIGATRGYDYVLINKNQIILKNTPKIISSPLCYRYERFPIGRVNPVIGREIDRKKKTIIDYVYDLPKIDMSIGPFTLGWTYDYKYSSVINGVMNLVESIPRKDRSNKLFVASYLCSRIDSCNDPINGIIEGRWKSTFTGGLEPNQWKSSSHVFSERFNKNSPVKYGQCWVLSDILTGILNFIGLKARTVKIQNCIMDLHLTGGFDALSDDLTFNFNPKDHFLHNAGNYKYIPPEVNIEKDPVYKGPIYSLQNDFKIDSKDLYDINYIISDNDNSSWNFHLWTEVCIDKEWYILDPSPLHDVEDFEPYNEIRGHCLLENKKFLGPVSISNIKKNITPLNNKHGFRYLHSCVNGKIRLWGSLITETGLNIMHLKNIKYNVPTVFQKTYFGSNVNVTSRYRDSYEDNHKYNPFYFTIKDNTMAKLYIQPRSINKSIYVLQLSLLFGEVPLYIHREIMTNIQVKNLLFLKDPLLKTYRQKADRITITIYDIKLKFFWSQCIQI